MLGTEGWPLDTTRLTTVPQATVPVADWLITLPAATVSLHSVVLEP